MTSVVQGYHAAKTFKLESVCINWLNLPQSTESFLSEVALVHSVSREAMGRIF
jgi:hypothetical protein